MLQKSDLSFHDFVELALYYPDLGYYARGENRVGKSGDYVTAPSLSPVFAFALSKLVPEFMSRVGDEASTIVDIGCGDGSLIHSLHEQAGDINARFYGVDRSLERVHRRGGVAFVRTLEEIPRGGMHLVLSNELFDAFPFARLVRRGEHLHELYVTGGEGHLDWTEHEAPVEYEEYFRQRGIALDDGQFADVSLEWERFYGGMCEVAARGLIVTFDYGEPEQKLFRRRFGSAASYAGQRVSRDLLSDPGERDLTAHVNFTDLIRTGEQRGFTTLFFDRQAKFLLALGITEHELFTPAQDVSIDSVEEGVALIDRREEARRLVLPDGIGNDIRVLVQSRGVADREWSFQRKLF